MRGILIDPYCFLSDDGKSVALNEDRAFTEVETTGKLEGIYQVLSHPMHKVNMIERADVPEMRDDLYVDEEGLYNNAGGYFIIMNYPQPLAGRGLIIAPTRNGGQTSTKLTLDWVRDHVRIMFSNLLYEPNDTEAPFSLSADHRPWALILNDERAWQKTHPIWKNMRGTHRLSRQEAGQLHGY